MKRNILSASILLVLALTAIAHAQLSVNSDLENLATQHPDFTRAYSLINATNTWKTIIDSGVPLAPVRVGISDTGIDAGHPEFAGVIVGGSRVGVVDLGRTPPGARVDLDSFGHGTEVAGIIGANNLLGHGVPPMNTSPQMNGILSGVPSLQYSLEMRRSFITDSFSFFGAIKNLSDDDVRIINLSMGKKKPSNLLTLLFWEGMSFIYRDTLTHFSDITFVVAAGGEERDAEDMLPANAGDLPNVITVSSTDLDDHRDTFSNFGTKVAMAAPGVQVYSPAPRGKGNFPADTKEYDQFFSGTSASAPFVTGVAGLIKAIKPELTPAEIKTILIKEANTDPVITDPDKPIGRRLNALKAICDPMVLGNAPGCPEGTATTTGTITGTFRLRGEDGGGVIAGANIFLLALPTQEVIAQTQTDTNGHYQFTAPLGNYDIFTDLYFIDGTSNCNEGRISVVVTPGQAVTGDITLTFTPGGLCEPV